jgi:hypothetical protein
MLNWEKYNINRLAVYYNNDGNKNIYHSVLRGIGGRWNSRMRGGNPGWLVPIENEKELVEIINNLFVNDITKKTKIHKQQNKYRREGSESDNSESDNSSEESDMISQTPQESVDDFIDTKEEKEKEKSDDESDRDYVEKKESDDESDRDYVEKKESDDESDDNSIQNKDSDDESDKNYIEKTESDEDNNDKSDDESDNDYVEKKESDDDKNENLLISQQISNKESSDDWNISDDDDPLISVLLSQHYNREIIPNNSKVFDINEQYKESKSIEQSDIVKTKKHRHKISDIEIKKNKESKSKVIEQSDMVKTKKHRDKISHVEIEKTKELTLKEKVCQLQRDKDEKRRKRNHLSNTNPIKYYNEFSKNPKTFRELYASSEEEMSSSSEDEESSSSDDFPSPNTPKKGYKANRDKQDNMSNIVKDLQKRLYNMEIQNKKLRAKIV